MTDAITDVAPQGLGFLLGVAHRRLRRAWEAEFADLELTAPQAALLRLIAAQPGQGVRQLARRLGTEIDRHRDVIEVTPAGKRHLRRLANAVKGAQGALLIPLFAPPGRAAVTLLQSLVEHHRGYRHQVDHPEE